MYGEAAEGMTEDNFKKFLLVSENGLMPTSGSQGVDVCPSTCKISTTKASLVAWGKALYVPVDLLAAQAITINT